MSPVTLVPLLLVLVLRTRRTCRQCPDGEQAHLEFSNPELNFPILFVCVNIFLCPPVSLYRLLLRGGKQEDTKQTLHAGAE